MLYFKLALSLSLRRWYNIVVHVEYFPVLVMCPSINCTLLSLVNPLCSQYVVQQSCEMLSAGLVIIFLVFVTTDLQVRGSLE